MGQCLNSAPPVWLRYFNYIFFKKRDIQPPIELWNYKKKITFFINFDVMLHFYLIRSDSTIVYSPFMDRRRLSK